MADWSMEPAAAWMPSDHQLASWTMEPAVCIPGHPVEYASTNVFGSCNHISLSVFDGKQQGDYEEVATHYYPIETTKKESVVGSHNMEMAINEDMLIEQVVGLHEADVKLTTEKMHRYPARIQALNLEKRYTTPTVVAIGPYHHNQDHLKQTEEMKHLAAIQCTFDSNRSFTDIYSAVVPVAHVARRLYNNHEMARLCHDDFLHMMFFDACFLVQYMRFTSIDCRDMKESLSSFLNSNNEDIFYDIMLLENQIPWPIVEAVMEFVSMPMKNFIYYRVGCLLDSKNRKEVPTMDPTYKPPHLLGLLRFYIVGRSKTQPENNSNESQENDKISFSVSASELAEMGIEIKANENTKLIDMGFKKKWPLFGELFLAPLSLDDARASLLVSMAALEMCTTSNFEKAKEDSAVCSYLLLLAMLVSTEEDVKKLRTQHILQGAGITNGEVLDFFKRFHRLRLGSCYVRTMKQIEDYRCKRRTRNKVYAIYYRKKGTLANFVYAVLGVATILGTIIAGIQLSK